MNREFSQEPKKDSWKERLGALLTSGEGGFLFPGGRSKWLCAGLAFLLAAGLLTYLSYDALSRSLDRTVAAVNGEKIARRDFKAALKNRLLIVDEITAHDSDETEALKKEVLDDLIDEKLMLQEARRLGISVGDRELASRVDDIKKDYDSSEVFFQAFRGGDIDFATWKEALKKRMLLEKLIASEVHGKVAVTDEEARSHFQQRKKKFVAEERVRVAQIVVMEEDEGERILKRLKDGEDFDKLARECSMGPEAQRGGDLGTFGRGVMPEIFDKAVFSLREGQVSRLIKSPYGFHIFKVLGREKKGTGSFEEVRERVKADLKKEKEERQYVEWLAGLRAKAAVEVREDVLAQVRVE